MWEIVVILVVVIVLVKPVDLPSFVRNLGRLYRRMREFYTSATDMVKRIESDMLQSESLVKGVGLEAPVSEEKVSETGADKQEKET